MLSPFTSDRCPGALGSCSIVMVTTLRGVGENHVNAVLQVCDSPLAQRKEIPGALGFARSDYVVAGKRVAWVSIQPCRVRTNRCFIADVSLAPPCATAPLQSSGAIPGYRWAIVAQADGPSVLEGAFPIRRPKCGAGRTLIESGEALSGFPSMGGSPPGSNYADRSGPRLCTVRWVSIPGLGGPPDRVGGHQSPVSWPDRFSRLPGTIVHR
jgi:hypothetical protein